MIETLGRHSHSAFPAESQIVESTHNVLSSPPIVAGSIEHLGMIACRILDEFLHKVQQLVPVSFSLSVRTLELVICPFLVLLGMSHRPVRQWLNIPQIVCAQSIL